MDEPRSTVDGKRCSGSCWIRQLQGTTWSAVGDAADEIERGQVLAKPGSINLTRSLMLGIRSGREEGGRHTPFQRIQAAVLHRTTDVTGGIEF